MLMRLEDSCSSSFVGWKPKRSLETPAVFFETSIALEKSILNSPAEEETSSTVINHTYMTTESQIDTSEDAADETRFKKDEYDNVELCEGQYETDYCLNGGTCILHQHRGEAIAYDCVCPFHFFGKRCDEKMLEGSYNGLKKRVHRSNRRTRKNSSPSPIIKYVQFRFCVDFFSVV